MPFDLNSIEQLLNANTQGWADFLGLEDLLTQQKPRSGNWMESLLGNQERGSSFFESVLGGGRSGKGDWFDFVLGQPTATRQSAKVQMDRPKATPVQQSTSQFSQQSAPQALPQPQATPAGTGIDRWAPIVQTEAAAQGVPLDVVMGVMEIESGGNPEAVGKPTKWGKAQGLMQVMPFHWPAGTPESVMRNPQENIKKAIGILAENFRRFGSWEAAAAAYFGAVDEDGTPNLLTDANGVNGVEYVQRFNNARSRYKVGW